MILKRFIKPKWQHNDPTVRLQAIEELSGVEQATLAGIARNDADPAVRRSACKRIEDLDLLQTLSRDDQDAGVRELAAARCRTLLCGQGAAPLPLEQRLRLLQENSDPRTLEQIARHGAESELRLAAIGRVDDQQVLAACAGDDSAARNRLLAVERLAAREALEKAVRKLRNRDKSAYRLARDKLKQIMDSEQAPARVRAQCLELCQRAEALGQFNEWLKDKPILDYLDKQWAELEEQPEAELSARYQRARERFLSAYETYRQANQAQVESAEAEQRLRAEKEGLLETLASGLKSGEEAKLADLLQSSAEEWDQLGSLPPAAEKPLARQYRELREQLEQRYAKLAGARQQAERLEAANLEIDSALHQGKPLDKKRLQSLVKETMPLAEQLAGRPMAERFGELRTQLEQRLKKQLHAAEQKLEHLPERLQQLEQALDAGQLRDCEPLRQSIQADLDLLQASAAPHAKYAPAEKELHRILARIRELKQWRKWGADQHRQELCERMEALIESDLALEQLAHRLHDEQIEWKNLDHSGAPVNQGLWDRFHAACDQVYERCKPYLDEQAALRTAHREQRERICAELEEFLDKVDWERIDWKKAAHAERDTRNAWRAVGPVENRYRKPLEKRFRKAMDRLDKRLSKERGRNLAFRRDLIARIEALSELPDLEQAIAEAKRLQREWHTTVPGRRKAENALWEQFRGACDRVFERRREEQEAQHQALHQNLEQRLEIASRLKTLAEEAADPEALNQGYRELRQAWQKSADLELAKSGYGRAKAAWQQAEDAYRERLAQLKQARQRAQLGLLREKAGLCRQLEQALSRPEPGDPQPLVEQWEAVGALEDGDLQAGMQRRYESALAAQTEGPDRDRLAAEQAANQQRREEICLHLEILSGVDSPPQLAEARMAFQVSRLSGHMAAGEGDPLEAAPQLERDWYLCGPAPEPAMSELETRFERARAALGGT